MKFILGQKIEMTQLFDEVGNVVPATVVKAGPCVVTTVKTKESDGYSAVQLGFGTSKKLSKAEKGHLNGLGDFRFLSEFRDKTQNSINKTQELKNGNIITVETFKVGDLVKVVGTSKGKGFQGVVRRHHFHGHPATHGHKDQERMPGAIGAGGLQHVVKGKRMAGHMGDEQITVKNLEIAKIDVENNLLYIRGAVPGARTGLLEIIGEGELKVKHADAPQIISDNTDTTKTEESKNEKTEEQKTEAAPAEAPAEEKAEAPAESKE
jgi:large subunit ribosomal protein L3